MTSGILGTALSGLMAFQQELNTTSNNIDNVNTEGYSRQSVNLAAKPALATGYGYVGSGVQITGITRSYNQFVSQQLRSSTSAYGEANQLYTSSSQLDNLISDSSTGLSSVLSTFFNDVSEVSNDPSSTSARQVMLGGAQSLTNTFNNLANQFNSLRSQVNSDMSSAISNINSYAQGIAALNKQIVSAEGQGSRQQTPNNLLDQRDLLLKKISQYADVSVVNQKDGGINVYIGQGQSLVQGGDASVMALQASPTDPTHNQVSLDGQNITDYLNGGELSGMLKFRDQVLDPAQQQLGLVAAGLTVKFNAVHEQGYDLNGTVGKPFFSLGSPAIPVTADPNLPGGGTVTATYDSANIGQLQPSDYKLNYSAGTYTLTRLSDHKVVASGSSMPMSVDGLKINVTSAPTADASFLIRPTFDAAQNISTAVQDPSQIAAAGSLSSQGTAQPGDNTNALKLADLANQPVLIGGKTIAQTYNQIVSQVGTATQTAKVGQAAQQTALNQATQAQSNISSVNLDQEAANLVKYQNAYQAAAKVISVSNSIFNTLITAVQ